MINKRILYNFISFFVSKLITIILFIFSLKYAFNRISSIEFSIITLSLTLFTYLWILDLGIGYTVNIRISRIVGKITQFNKLNKSIIIKKISSHALFLYLCISILLAVLCLLSNTQISNHLFKNSNYSFFISGLGYTIIPTMISALCTAIIKSYNKIYLCNYSQLLLDILRAASIVAACNTHKPLETLIILFIASSTIKTIIDYIITTKLVNGPILPRFNLKESIINIQHGLPAMGSLIVFALFFVADKFILANFLTIQELAIYSISMDVNTKMFFSIWAVNASLYQPIIYARTQRKSATKFITLNILSAIALSLIYYVPLFYLATHGIKMWLNQEFAIKASPLIKIMIPGSIFYIISSSIENSILRTSGKTKPIFYSTLFMMTVMIISIPIFTTNFGITGSAAAYSLSLFSLLILMLYNSVSVHQNAKQQSTRK